MNDVTRLVALAGTAALLIGGCDQGSTNSGEAETPVVRGPGATGTAGSNSTGETSSGNQQTGTLDERSPGGSAPGGQVGEETREIVSGTSPSPSGSPQTTRQNGPDQSSGNGPAGTQIDQAVAERAAENEAARRAAERRAGRDEESGTTPEMTELLGDLASLNPGDITRMDPAQARQQPGISQAVAASTMRTRGGAEPEQVGRVEEATYAAAAGNLPVRVYWPAGAEQNAGDLPVVVYWHGGGFVLADLNTYDASARAICNAADCIVVAPEYRHAPENPFPAAPEDAMAAYQWTLANAETMGGDPGRVAVAGESAGGNLACVVGLLCREQGVPMPVHQVLIYPLADWTMDTASYREHAAAKPLGRQMMEWFRGHYLGTDATNIDWRAAPLRAESFDGMPPTTIITADIDPLRSDGEALASRLQDDGVWVNLVNYVGVTHEFFGAGAVIPEAREAARVVGADLQRAFGRQVGNVGTDGE